MLKMSELPFLRWYRVYTKREGYRVVWEYESMEDGSCQVKDRKDGRSCK